MGQENTTPIDESTPPQTLETRNLDGIAKYIKSGKAKKIVLMTGAGISTSAGIPDFRSPDTGLYANLARLNLPYAEAVFDISYFRKNPTPFYTLAHELYPGRFRPTVTHSFFKLLQDKGLLLKLFTQNIDCLEREAGVSGNNIVEAHGSFATQSCIECKSSYPDDKIKQHVEAMTIPRCLKSSCDGLVKPEIVFFGEQLPAEFFASRHLPAKADLCIVLGTSLTVQPFASLPSFCSEGVPRLLINKERVGDLGSRPDDVLLLDDCDAGVRRLAMALGWDEELEKSWAATAPKGMGDLGRAQKAPPKSREEALDDEVAKLTKDVDAQLNISKAHTERVRKEQLNEDEAKRETQLEKVKGDSDKAEKEGDPKTPHYDEKAADESLKHVYPHIDNKSSL
ncbi:hypothetical protein MBLNU457_2208t1 [Dothideomycetes sp. NU457]